MLLELWGMQSTPSLPSLPGSFWPQVIAPYTVFSMCSIKIFYIFAQSTGAVEYSDCISGEG